MNQGGVPHIIAVFMGAMIMYKCQLTFNPNEGFLAPMPKHSKKPTTVEPL
jgi:hypothetical protein